MIYKTKRLDEVKNNLGLIIQLFPFPWLVYSLITATKLKVLIKILIMLWLIHAVYWIILQTEPTTYKIDENGIRWKNKFISGYASWNGVHIKFKDNKAEVHVKLTFLVVKKITLPKKVIACS